MENPMNNNLGKSMLELTKDNKNLLRVAMEIAGHGDRTGDDSITDQIAVKSSGEIMEGHPRGSKLAAAMKARNIARTDKIIAKNNPGMSGKRAEDARLAKFDALPGKKYGDAHFELNNNDRIDDIKVRGGEAMAFDARGGKPSSPSDRRKRQKEAQSLQTRLSREDVEFSPEMDAFADFIIEQLQTLEETLDFELQDSDLDFAINSIIDNLLD